MLCVGVCWGWCKTTVVVLCVAVCRGYVGSVLECVGSVSERVLHCLRSVLQGVSVCWSVMGVVQDYCSGAVCWSVLGVCWESSGVCLSVFAVCWE